MTQQHVAEGPAISEGATTWQLQAIISVHTPCVLLGKNQTRDVLDKIPNLYHCIVASVALRIFYLVGRSIVLSRVFLYFKKLHHKKTKRGPPQNPYDVQMRTCERERERESHLNMHTSLRMT